MTKRVNRWSRPPRPAVERRRHRRPGDCVDRRFLPHAPVTGHV